MAYTKNTAPAYQDIVIKTISDLPTPSSGMIQLQDNASYRFKGLVNIGTNRIVMGVSNTIFGIDKSDDGIVYTGTDSAIMATNRSLSINNINFVTSTGKAFDITNSSAYSVQIRECIFSGLQVGRVAGGLLFAFNNNIVGSSGDLEVTGVFSKVGISTKLVALMALEGCISIT